MMDEHYHPQTLETSAQQYWADNNSFAVQETPNNEKFYCLTMFPYPSGKLHMGHVRNYTIGDVIARFQRMQGKNVMQPIGWDAFGLPAENAAIAHKTAPATWTYQNIENMKTQLKGLGFGYDWQRELATCKPEYYRWEQWFFTELYKKNLVYKKESTVNWCPNDQTVLANEQVEDGRCWRCDTLVERKALSQWFVRITTYADELLQDLDQLEGWPDQVKAMQRNWIGRSEGVEMTWQIKGSDDTFTVYTTRPDTLMGVTYIALAPQHALVIEAAKCNSTLANFAKNCKKTAVSESTLATQDKLGMNTGLIAIHPVTGEDVPVWTANFILADYGSGAVMSVPAHDQRDWEFAQKYQLPIKQVITTKKNENSNTIDLNQNAFTDKGQLINSGQFDYLSSNKAFDAIANWLQQNKKGQRKVNYRLRDWGVSRQRYWGTPIPMRYLEDGSIEPVPEQELPVTLPEDVILDGMHSPLKTDASWSEVIHNGQQARKETDTFDTFMESSWYYARYCCPDENTRMLDSEKANYWLPVDQYVGGIEHAVMHLLYARFFHKLLRDSGLVSSDEPFKRLLCQGMVLADAFYKIENTGTKKWIALNEVTIEYDNKGNITQAIETATGDTVKHAGMTKMSKSKNNGIDPQQLIEKYGADTARLYTMFAAPPEQTLEWSDNAAEGANRFLRRLWKMNTQFLADGIVQPVQSKTLDSGQKSLRRKVHETISKVTDDFKRRMTFNTAIASIMELSNHMSRFNDDTSEGRAVMQEALCTCIRLLAPVTPHICHHLWLAFGHTEAVIDAPWPVVDKAALTRDCISLVIQVNGKVRAKLEAPTGSDKTTLKKLALEQPNVIKFTEGKIVHKIIVVPEKLVNIVVK